MIQKNKLGRFSILVLVLQCVVGMTLVVNGEANSQVSGKAVETTTAKSVYMPLIVETTAAERPWSPVGDKPVGVNRFYDVAVCGKQGSQKLAGTDKGLYIFANNKWVHETGPIPDDKIVPGVTFVPRDDGACTEAYVASVGGGIWYGKRENTWTWTRVDKELSEAYSVLVVDDTLLVAGGFGVHATTPLPTSDAAIWEPASEIMTLTLSLTSSSNNVVLAAVWAEGVFVEGQNSLGERTWSPLNNDRLEDRQVYEAEANNRNAVTAGTTSGLYRRENNQWAAIAVEHQNPTFAVKNVGSNMYAGQATAGVLWTMDGGSTWVPMNKGITGANTPGFQVRGFHLGDDGKLYAATTSGVWVWSGRP